MNISTIMTKDPIILKEKSTVLDAIKKMQSEGCGILPIGSHKHIKGVITDRDILLRAISKNTDLSKIPVTDVMSKDVVFCEEEESLEQAVSQMNQNHMHRVLVKDKNQSLSGILSFGDIIQRVQDKMLLANLFKEAISI